MAQRSQCCIVASAPHIAIAIFHPRWPQSAGASTRPRTRLRSARVGGEGRGAARRREGRRRTLSRNTNGILRPQLPHAVPALRPSSVIVMCVCRALCFGLFGDALASAFSGCTIYLARLRLASHLRTFLDRQTVLDWDTNPHTPRLYLAAVAHCVLASRPALYVSTRRPRRQRRLFRHAPKGL